MSERILIVDDEAAIREILTLSVTDLGYEAQAAANGEEALALLERYAPDIVLTDIKMPGMDGIELLRRIKERNPDIEVIMISGHGDMELTIQSLQYEALDFITKPVRDALLINALKRAVERIAMRRQIRDHTRNLERIVKEKSARLVELERQIAVGQVVEGLSSTLRSLTEALDEEPGYFNQLPCFISIHNRYLEIVAVNQLHKSRLGDYTGCNSWETYANRTDSGNACPVQLTIEHGKGLRSHETLLTRDGRELPVLVHTAPIFNQKQEVELVLEMSVDISEVSRLQELARAATEKFQRLFDAVPCAIAVVDREFNVMEANRLFRRDLGEAQASRCFELLQRRHEPCSHCVVQDTFIDGESHQTETVLVTRQGEPRNVLLQTAPLHDEAGRIAQVMEIATDITQIRALQDHLSSLGIMLGSMSHGVKGLLTSLDGGVFKVDAGLRRDDPEKVREGWPIVRDKIGRIRKMVLDILYYAKSREPELAQADVRVFAQDLRDIVSPKAAELGVHFELRCDPEPGIIELDENAMTSAMVNFLENALDACAEDKTKSRHQVVLSVGSSDEFLRFRIEDNGIGMDEETRGKIFTLFFSSKGARGTGLGLFISSRIVEQHKGSISVESTPGQGSVIEITLPRSRSEA